MFAKGDRVSPVDDLGGGVWSRCGTVLAVHAAPHREPTPGEERVRVEAAGWLPFEAPRATVLWDDGTAEIIAEDRLLLVYDRVEPLGIRVVTMAMAAPVDVVEHGGHVVLLLREGLLPPPAVQHLREKLRSVRASFVPAGVDGRSPAEIRRRDLDLLRALIAQLTG
ncbi:hypothetical protein [Candidatus Protofrankia datiscae]|uniref:Uncharacterized protein n=1 Tax=Candidatus Protofrankia datiscae TaxID=2716812 RepID=F8AVE8_9ACTN|nr:hypothetical protein [Candidatus Protofrankia datiscae]AEH08244.1 hypothetical protein FsymDg_0724 [Candidatus Protofrankia datiscae]